LEKKKEKIEEFLRLPSIPPTPPETPVEEELPEVEAQD